MFLRPWRNATRLPGCGLVGCQALTSVADALIGGAFVILTVAQLVLWSTSSSAEKPWDNSTSVVLVAIWFSAALHLLFATVLEAVLPIAPRGPTENGDSSSPLQSKVLARVHHLFYGDAHVTAACAICLFVPLRDASVADALSGRSSVVDELSHWAHLLAWCSWLHGLPLSAHQFSLVAWPLVVLGVVAGAPDSPCRVNFGALEASDDQSSNSGSDSNGSSSSDDGLLGGLLVGCDLLSKNLSDWSLWTVLATATLCVLCLSSCCFAVGFSKKPASLPKLKPPTLGDDQAQFDNQSRTASISRTTSRAMYALDVLSPLSALLLVALCPLPALLAFAFSATVLAIASFCASGSSANGPDRDQNGQSSGLRARATGVGGGASRAVIATAESTDSWAPTDVAASTSRDVTLVWPRLPDVESGNAPTGCSGCLVSSSSLSCWTAGCCCCSSEAVSGVGLKVLWPLAYGPGTYRRPKCIARWENGTNLLLLAGNDDNDCERTTAQQREELVGALTERLRLPPPPPTSSSMQGRNSSSSKGGGGGRNRPRSPHTSFARSGSGSGGAGKRGSAASRNGSSYKPSTTSAVAKPLPAFFSSGAVRVPVPSKPKNHRHKTTASTATTNGGASTPRRAPPSRLPSIGSFLHSPSSARTGSGNHFFQFKPSKAHWQGMLNEPGEERSGCNNAYATNDGLRSPRNSFVLGADDGGAAPNTRNSNHHRYAAFTTKSPEPKIGRRYEEEDIEDKDEYYDDVNNGHYELTEAAQARDTATEATLWKHKISYHGHHLQQPPNHTPNDKGRASKTTATPTGRKSRASRDSQGDDNGGGEEDPSQSINDLTSRPVRESTESIGANAAAMKSKGNNSNRHPRRKSGGSKQQQPSVPKGGNSRFKSAAPPTANEPGRMPTPMPQARTVKRSRAPGQQRAETYVVGGLRSPANATKAQGSGASGDGGGKGSFDSRGGYEPTVWPKSSSGKTMRGGGGGRSGTPLPLSNKHPASSMRGPSRSRAPNLVTIPAGTSMDARI